MPDPMQQPSPLRLDGQPETTEPGTIQPVPQLVIDAADSFNYAAWQNAVPLLRSVTIDNTNGPGFSSLTVELKASPAFARTRRWLIDRIGAGEKLTLKDIDVDIDPDHLNRLDEAERGVLTFTLLHQDSPLHEATHVLRVLARDEWGGMSTMGELLPAFVTPNEPALATLLKAAADALERHGHDSALDGYQSRDPKRAYLLTGALWSAVCAARWSMPTRLEVLRRWGKRLAASGRSWGMGWRPASTRPCCSHRGWRRWGSTRSW